MVLTFCFFVCLLGADFVVLVVVVFWGKSHIALKFYVDKDCPKCQVRTGMVCRLDYSTAQNGPCAPGGAGFLRGAGPAQPEGPGPIVGAEVSGLRSMVQGATSGLPGLKRWLSLIRGYRP